MFQLIFKIIYIVPFAIIMICNAGIIGMIVKESGFQKPYVWMIFIGVVAYMAEGFCYKGWIK